MNEALRAAKRKAWAEGKYAHVVQYKGGSRRDLGKFWAARVAVAQAVCEHHMDATNRIRWAIAVDQFDAHNGGEKFRNVSVVNPRQGVLLHIEPC